MRDETKIELSLAEAEGIRYDNAAKRVWVKKEILAPVLKYSVREFKEFSVAEIIKLIDADVVAETTPVSDVPLEVINRNVEQNAYLDIISTFDISFDALNPKLSDGKVRIYLHFDFEIQNKYRPGYPITKRAIYYGARALSRQLGALTENTDYSGLEKIYSIWVCNDNVPEKLQNTQTRFYIAKEDIKGVDDEPEEYYDLIEVVIIRRGDRVNEKTGVFDYLRSVFEADIERIEDYVGAGLDTEEKGQVEDMGGMGMALYEKGLSKGIAEGKAEGKAEGRAEGKAEGRAEGKLDILYQLVHENLIGLTEAVSRSGQTEDAFISGLKRMYPA